MQAEIDAVHRCLSADLGGKLLLDAHAPAALVLKGVQAHFRGVFRHLHTVFISLLGKALAGAGGSE